MRPPSSSPGGSGDGSGDGSCDGSKPSISSRRENDTPRASRNVKSFIRVVESCQGEGRRINQTGARNECPYKGRLGLVAKTLRPG